MSLGTALALLGASLAMVMAAVGSSIGVVKISSAATGILSKEPKHFSKLLILMLLPSSQSIYALTVSFMLLSNLGIVGGEFVYAISTASGLSILFLCLPVGIIGMISAIVQGNVGVTAVKLYAKQNKTFGNCIIIISGSEVFALFGFLISMLGVLSFTFAGYTYYYPQVTESVAPVVVQSLCCYTPSIVQAMPALSTNLIS